jgi:chaperonin GroEL (HSP60 family)
MDINEEDMGYAELVESKKISEEEVVFFEGCRNPGACTFFVRGGTKEVAKEHKNVIYDAIRAVASVIDSPFVLPGGGAIETELSLRLRKVAATEKTKKQLAMISFSDALESIPKTLAWSCGLNPLDAIAELRARHQTDTDSYVGIWIKEGEEVTMENNVEKGIIEPLGVRKQVLIGAVEVTELILLTDGILRDKERMKKVKEEQRRESLGIKEEGEEKEEEEIFQQNFSL